AADRGAVLFEDALLMTELFGLRRPVRVVGVLRRGAQGLLLAAARDPQRNARSLQRLRLHDRAIDLEVLAVEGRAPGLPGLRHDLDALVERAQPVADRREP